MQGRGLSSGGGRIIGEGAAVGGEGAARTITESKEEGDDEDGGGNRGDRGGEPMIPFPPRRPPPTPEGRARTPPTGPPPASENGFVGRLIAVDTPQEDANDAPHIEEMPYWPPMLFLSVMRAQRLASADLFSKSDPYCEVFVDDDKVGITAVVPNTLNPEWTDERFELVRVVFIVGVCRFIGFSCVAHCLCKHPSCNRLY